MANTAPTDRIFIGRGTQPVHLPLAMANRHGLIAGATGTGKTATLRVLVEGFSRAGIPVFLADVKGDLSGLAAAAVPDQRIEERIKAIRLPTYEPRPLPVVFWDLFGEQGHPLRTTVSEVGPLLLGRLLDLNDVQEGVLNVVFRLADERGLLLLDLKDLRAVLAFAAENAAAIGRQYGAVSRSSVAAVQRALLVVEEQGGDRFLGEPALDPIDLIRSDPAGQGIVNVLAADRLMQSPRLYAMVLLWLLAELYERLPEVGDLPKPRLIFVFDEAHLLFDDAPKALVDKVEQVVRLIRSKGVGVFFVSQSPLDIPDTILGQLGNRVQHALRAYTPRDQVAVRAAAETMRPNPKIDTVRAITELGIGEALVSTLDPKGIPGIVERALVRPPETRFAPLSPAERSATMAASPVGARYDRTIDRESAHEILARRTDEAMGDSGQVAGGPWGNEAPPAPRRRGSVPSTAAGRAPRQREGLAEAMAKSAMRAVGSAIGRQIVRGILGGILKRR